MRLILLALLLLNLNLNCTAQVVQNFTLNNVTDEAPVTLDSFSSSPGVVIIFTSINCPYDGYYQIRIKELAETYHDKIPMILINANLEESTLQMKRHVEQYKLTMPYLADLEQKVFGLLKPRKNPECFLLEQVAGKFVVAYHGAIDDNAQTAAAVNQQYLKDAINRLLAKQKMEMKDVRPVGCSIQKKN
jgi:peroxiredoxin